MRMGRKCLSFVAAGALSWSVTAYAAPTTPAARPTRMIEMTSAELAGGIIEFGSGATATAGKPDALLYDNNGGVYLALQEAGGIEPQTEQVFPAFDRDITEWSVVVTTSSCGGTPWADMGIPTMDVRMVLRENDDQGTPGDFSDDMPGCEIAGTSGFFTLDLSSTYSVRLRVKGINIPAGSYPDGLWPSVTIISAPRPGACSSAGLSTGGWRIAECAEVGFTDNFYSGLLGPFGFGNCASEFGGTNKCPADPKMIDICFWFLGASDCTPGVQTGDPWAGFTTSLNGPAAASLELVPISASGPHTIVGNEIILPKGGVTIEAELRVNWDLDQQGNLLSAAQGQWPTPLDDDGDPQTPPVCPSFTSAKEGQITPAGVSLDTGRQDYAFAGIASFPATDDSTCANRVGAALGIAATPPGKPGSPAYLGSITFEVSTDAHGTFEIELNPDRDQSFVSDETGTRMEPVRLVSMKVTVQTGSCCYDLGGTPVCVDNATENECDAQTGPRVYFPGDTCADHDPCPLLGACCDDATGVCTDGVLQTTCESGGDRYGGDGSGCATIDPPCVAPPTCGDNVLNQATELCDGTDDAACPGQCRPDCTCPLPPPPPPGDIPTVSEWGIAIMALLLLIGAMIYFSRRRVMQT